MHTIHGGYLLRSEGPAASVAGLRVAPETWLSGDDKPPLTDLVVEVLDRLDGGLRAYDKWSRT